MANPKLIFDLRKALDKSKLVKVQRSVTRNGKTFMQNFWVSPDQVRTTDKVIGNHSVLQMYQVAQKTLNAVRTAAKSKLDINHFNALKNKKDRAGAIKYAKDCGVSWAEHDNEAINWMRVCMAVGKLKDDNISVPKQGQLYSTDGLDKIDQATFDAADAKGKTKQLVTALGRGGAQSLIKKLGGTWDTTGNAGIDWMRASMAIQKFVDGKTYSQLTSDVTTGSPTAAPSAQPVDPDTIKITAEHSEREQAMIALINQISDLDDIELFTKSGMIAEDDDAKEYIKNTLMKNYANTSSASRAGRRTTPTYCSNYALAKLITTSCKAFKGIPKRELDNALSRAKYTHPDVLLNLLAPRGHEAGNGVENRSSIVTLPDLVTSMSAFDDMVSKPDAPDSYYSRTPAAYGFPLYSLLEDSLREFDEDCKDTGFIKALQHIKEQDPELSDECDRLQNGFVEMMKISGNSYVLFDALSRSDYNTLNDRVEEFTQVIDIGRELFNLLQNANIDLKDVDTWNSFAYFAIDTTSHTLKITNHRGDILTHLPITPHIEDAFAGSKAHLVQRVVSCANINPQSLDKAEKALTKITPDLYDKFKSLQYGLTHMKVCEISTGVQCTKSPHELKRNELNGYNPDYNLFPDGVHPKTDAVLGNLSNMSTVSLGLTKLALSDFPLSKANNQGNDFYGNCTFYRRGTGLNKARGYADRADDQSSYADYTETTQVLNKQLKNLPVIPLKELEEMNQYAIDNGTTDCRVHMSWTDFDSRITSLSLAYSMKGASFDKSSIGFKVVLQNLEALMPYIPQVRNTRVKTDDDSKKYLRKIMDIDERDLWKPASAITQSGSGMPNVSNLLKLRTNLLSKANCSIRTLTPSEQTEVLHRVKLDFDHNDDKGRRVPKDKRAYANRTLVFHGNTYEVKNSKNQEELAKEAKNLGETPQIMYHGTSYGAAASIVGVEGQFRISGKDANSRSGTMLGNGIYSAKLVGKTLPYIGNSTYDWGFYNQTVERTPNNAADGILLVCEGVLGKSYHSDISTHDAAMHNNGTYDSVSVGAGATMGGNTLKEFERIVTRKSMIAPKYIVDCGGRQYDRSIKTP